MIRSRCRHRESTLRNVVRPRCRRCRARSRSCSRRARRATMRRAGEKSSCAIGARLQPIAGGVGHGLITFRPYDGGLVLVADVGGFSAGPYRIVIHTTPVCTSPNGFSAGPPFVPAGRHGAGGRSHPHVGTRHGDVVDAGPGTHLERAHGHRRQVDRASREPVRVRSTRVPALPNDRVACGVIGADPDALLSDILSKPVHGPPAESRWAFSPARRF